MYFSFGYNLHQLLFSSINVSSVTGLVAVIGCTLVLVLLFEVSKVGSAYSKYYSATLRPNERPDCYTEDMLLVENHVPTKSTRYAWLVVEVGFYMIEIVLGYVVMLLVMTYNGYLLLTVLIASGIGYFLVGQILMLIQIKTSKLDAPCQQCQMNPKNSSITSSTEAISDCANDGLENKCCLRDNSDIVTVEETKY